MIHELGSFVTRAPRPQEREGGMYSLIYTLQGTNISHLGKRKIIFKHTWGGDMLVSRRVTFGGLIPTLTLEVNQTGADFLKKGHNFNTTPSEEIHITFIFHCHGTTSSKPFLLRILYPSSFCTWQNLELKQPTKHIPTNKKTSHCTSLKNNMSWWDQMSSAFVTFSSVFQKNLSITQASSFTTSTRSWDNRLFQQLSPYYFFRLNQEELDETTTILFFKGPINTGIMPQTTAGSLASTNLIHLGEPGPGVEKSCEQFGGFIEKSKRRKTNWNSTLFDLKHPYHPNFQGIKCINIMEPLTESLFGYQNRAPQDFVSKPLFPPCTLDARKWPFSLSSTVKVTYIPSGWYRWVLSSSGVDALFKTDT